MIHQASLFPLFTSAGGLRWPSARSILTFMPSDVTRILSAIEQGDPSAAGELLPLVYEELRKLAAQRLAQEKHGQTLQATALVHEAYLRLVDVDRVQHWNSRGHFFAAAAESKDAVQRGWDSMLRPLNSPVASIDRLRQFM